jgi:DNA repair protein RecN (Recombination protein N)
VTEIPGRLVALGVADLALLERVRLDVEAGFTVITGETGAGKSLLIDALGLALGARADAGLVRHGATAARVEALFDRMPEPLIVLREVTAVGRSTARVDDEPVTAARLAETTAALVEIHGQHEQQRLLDGRRQRDLLDAYAGAESSAARVASAVAAWRENEVALATLGDDPREIARRLAVAAHEIAEIDGAHVRVGETAEIQTALAAARHGETIARGSEAILAALVGSDASDAAAARDAAAGAERVARDLARIHPAYSGIADRLAGLEAELADVAEEVRAAADAVEHDPAAIARLEERASAIFALERRYGEDEAAVLAYRDRLADEVARLEGIEAERDRRAAHAVALLAEVADAARALSATRTEAAADVAPRVEAVVHAIGMSRARFRVEVARRTGGSGSAVVEIDGMRCGFDASGVDDVTFVIAPNPGEPARPLGRIASGGELSRVALALERVLADVDRTPTLVFDEIDTGIGGRSAEPVAQALWSLGRGRSVLCVTHLPVIAAYADAHVRIAKVEREGRTVTDLRLLSGDERVGELALMVGGPGGGPAATATAREMLDRAATWRASAR